MLDGVGICRLVLGVPAAPVSRRLGFVPDLFDCGCSSRNVPIRGDVGTTASSLACAQRPGASLRISECPALPFLDFGRSLPLPGVLLQSCSSYPSCCCLPSTAPILGLGLLKSRGSLVRVNRVRHAPRAPVLSGEGPPNKGVEANHSSSGPTSADGAARDTGNRERTRRARGTGDSNRDARWLPPCLKSFALSPWFSIELRERLILLSPSPHPRERPAIGLGRPSRAAIATWHPFVPWRGRRRMILVELARERG